MYSVHCTRCIVHTVHRVVILQRLQSDFMPIQNDEFVKQKKVVYIQKIKNTKYKIQNTKYY